MKQNLQDKLEIRLRAYSINEVAELYQFSLKSMKTWLSHYAK
jgi:transposase